MCIRVCDEVGSQIRSRTIDYANGGTDEECAQESLIKTVACDMDPCPDSDACPISETETFDWDLGHINKNGC